MHTWGKIPRAEAGSRYMLICDEAHYMQNVKAKRTQAALELASHASVLVLATGTPVES